MNFLAPYFLIGAAAIAGPIIFHLIRQAVKDRVQFSSLMFLKPTPPRVTRRRKLEHPWLLFLRCLCLALLALGFARPYFSRDDVLPAQSGEERQIILLVDTSASMQREGLWNQARAVAGKYLAQAGPGDQVAVVTFDRQPHTLVSFAQWNGWAADQRAALTKERLTATTPGWMATQLGLALTSAAEQFGDDSAGGKPSSHREVVLITDLQEGAKLDGLQGHEWPAGVSVILERVEAKQPSNAGLEIMSDAASPNGDGKEIRVRITNARDASLEKFHLNWTGATGEQMEIYLPPGQTRSFAAPKLPAGAPAGSLQLTGDAADFDNRSWYAAPEAEAVTIAWLGSESANDPATLRFYLQRVFPETPRRKVNIVSPTATNVFAPEWLRTAALAVIPNPLTSDEITATRDWLTQGKTGLLVLTGGQMGPTLEALTGVPDLKITEVADNYALLGQLDFKHPLFAPFADPRYSDFAHIHFWKHRRLAFPEAAHAGVLASFDDGSPALGQIPVGKGNLLVLTSGWNPGDSQLAVSSKFPPLMQTMLDWSGAAAPARSQYLTGEAIPLPGHAAAAVEWQKPDGKQLTLAAGTPFTETDLPGIYTAMAGGKVRHFAVNLSLDESRTAPLSPDKLARLGVPMQLAADVPAVRAEEHQCHLQQAELENRQKLWRWLIVGVLAVTLGEILLGGWLARRVKTAEATV